MKKRAHTRRWTALKRLAILLALILALDALGLYHVLPVQAMRQCAASAALGDVEIVKTMSDRRLDWGRYYLCANEDAVALLGTQFHPLLGWQRQFAPFAPLTGDEPVKACYQNFNRDGQDTSVFYVFGRIDDPGVKSITLRIYWYGDQTDVDTFADIPGSAYLEHGGHTYFLADMSSLWLQPAEDYGNTKLTAAGQTFLTPYLADGTALPEYEIQYGSWTMLD